MRHEETYKGFNIQFEASRDGFSAFLDGERALENTSLKALKLEIDKQVKKGFKRFNVYSRGRWGHGDKFEVWSVTSIVGGNAWLIGKSKNREKVQTHGLIPVNDHNTKIVGEISAIENQIEKLGEKKEALEQKLKYFEVKGEE